MKCVYCGNNTRVTNSRHKRSSNTVWRRRQCMGCKQVFTSREQADLSGSLLVRHRSGKTAPYSRDVLFISLYESCRHRPNALAEAGALAETAIATLLKQQEPAGLITTTQITTAVRAMLQRFDAAAATYYNAYYTAKKPAP